MNKEIRDKARDLIERIRLLVPYAKEIADKGLEQYKSAQADYESGVGEECYDLEVSADYLDDVVCKLETAIDDLYEVI